MPRLFDLSIHVASRWIFNCYVVEGDPPFVVDAGLRCTAREAVATLRELGASRVRVLSTHGHSDHVGGIGDVIEAFDASVHLPVRCEAYLAGEAARTPGLPEVVKILPVLGDQRFDGEAMRDFLCGADIGYGRSTTMQLPFDPDGYLRDGDTVPSTRDWQVIHAPGHADDSTCLYHPESATLISGDAVLTHGGRAWFNPEVVDRASSAETEERLRALDVRHLLPGHGLPLEGTHLLRDARSFLEPAPGPSVLARLARALGRWS
ncbi:MAG TPA: MBL fold metallo-hydrolase [Polyangiaceae bacterium]|nr:MBL fold metallo-hydrolase [Polyangiaceae bacterium]